MTTKIRPVRNESQWRKVYAELVREYFRRHNRVIVSRATHWYLSEQIEATKECIK